MTDSREFPSAAFLMCLFSLLTRNTRIHCYSNLGDAVSHFRIRCLCRFFFIWMPSISPHFPNPLYLFLLVSHFRRYGTKCSGCGLGIAPSELVRKPQDKVFHLNCFSCYSCKRQLSTGDHLYVVGDNKFLCKDDYFLTKHSSLTGEHTCTYFIEINSIDSSNIIEIHLATIGGSELSINLENMERIRRSRRWKTMFSPIQEIQLMPSWRIHYKYCYECLKLNTRIWKWYMHAFPNIKCGSPSKRLFIQFDCFNLMCMCRMCRWQCT